MKANNNPPAWASRFIQWFCPDHLLEEIEGDLIQKFERDVKAFGEQKARRRFVWNVIRFFRPGILLRNQFSFGLNQISMLRNYLVLAIRSLVRNKLSSIINITGLSVSMVVCMLIFRYVMFELSYDKLHENSENIYRIPTKVTLQNEVINHETNTYVGIINSLKTDFPEVIASTSIYAFTSDQNFISYADSNGEIKPLQSFTGISVDSNFFDVFSFPLLVGNQDVAVDEPYSALLSASLANRYFDGNPIGKILEIDDGEDEERYTITGVLKDVPANSHVKFDLVVRGASKAKNFLDTTASFWDWGGQTYALLHDNASTTTLEKKLNVFALTKNELKRNKDDYGQVSTFELQPLLDIHLTSHLQYELESNGSRELVLALIVLALIIIVIAWVNYANLTTALTEEKTKSIVMRKIVGATRSGLMMQVLTESALFNILSVILALLVAHLLLPTFSNFVGIPLSYSMLYDRWVLLGLLGFIILSTAISGFYPAFIISSKTMVQKTVGRFTSASSFNFRKILVVFQFAVATLVIITTVVVYQQLSFMRSEELGFNIDQVAVVKAMNFDKEVWSKEEGGFVIDSSYQNKVELFKEELRSHVNISNASSLSHLPGELPNWGTEFKAEVNDPEKAFRLIALGVDYDFINTLQIKLLAGRNFSLDFPSDHGNEGKRAVLINETASKLLGFKTPQDAVHSHISTYWGADYEIIGVMDSFHQLSLKEKLMPLYFILQPRALEYFAINFKGEQASETMEQIQTVWSHYFPDRPFDYFFLDEYFDKQYRQEKQFSVVMASVSGLAVFIACLGLFGLTSHAIVQRTKEIGIRKVLGASVSNVIGLFSRDFIKLILIGNVIAIPLVYVGLNQWLDNYAFKIGLSWWLFLIPVILILLIAFATVSLQTLKIAFRNPVDSLKNE